MIKFPALPQTFPNAYIGQSRFLTHAAFWVGYYVLFSFVWNNPERGLFASFYLEFILMPMRIMAAYCMIYFLIPNFLVAQQYKRFLIGYLALILVAACVQMTFSHFFYERLLLGSEQGFEFSFANLIRNIVLINTTVLLLGTAKVFQLYIQLQQQLSEQEDSSQNSLIEVKSNRRTHLIKPESILFIEGMGNYVNYYLEDGDKKIVYSSIKEAQKGLPSNFIRLHRSYIVNVQHIRSFSTENVQVAEHDLPRGKDVTDNMLVTA